MTKAFALRLAAAAAIAATPAVASAQGWAPGSEIVGQPIQVTTGGVTNLVYLDAGGALRILTPSSQTIPGTWQVASGQLCMNVAGATECIPYTSPFLAGQPQTFTTSCNAQTTWLAQNTNQQAPQGRSERGR